MMSQNIRISDDFVFINENKVAKLEVVSSRYKYKMYNLEGNLLLEAKVVHCNTCKQSNEISFELTNLKYANPKTLTVLEESFSRSKEFIKMLFQYKLIDEKGVYLDKIFLSTDRELLGYYEEKLKEQIVDLTKINYSANGNEAYIQDKKSGYFTSSESSINIGGTEIKFKNHILYDLDHNYIAAYTERNEILDIQLGDYIRIRDALQINKVVLRNGVTYVDQNLENEQIYKALLEKSLLNYFSLGNEINSAIKLKLTNKNSSLIDKSGAVFLAKYKNNWGVGSFKKISGFSDKLNFKEDNSTFFFQPMENGNSPLIIKGLPDTKITLQNYHLSSDFIAFEVVNQDIVETVELIKSVLDYRPDFFEFRKIVFENKNFLIASDGTFFFLKNKVKSKGIRLLSKNEKMLKELSKYLEVDISVLNDLDTRSLDSLISFLNHLK